MGNSKHPDDGRGDGVVRMFGRQWAEDIGSGIRDLIGPQRGTVGADDLLDWQPCDVPDLEFACSAYLAVPQHDAPLFLAVSHVQADVVFFPMRSSIARMQ